jgi:hypothetical protein
MLAEGLEGLFKEETREGFQRTEECIRTTAGGSEKIAAKAAWSDRV